MPNHNFIDLTGQTFNWLFVESRAENTNEGRAMWNCRCLLCGNKCVVYGKYLRNGSTKSCGCYRKEQARERIFEDLTGQTFNSLHVDSYSHKNKWNESVWNCTCILCGKQTHTATTAALKSGRIKTCGCTRTQNVSKVTVIDLTDKKCGLLTPKYIVGRNKANSVLWYSECECGGNIITTAHMLISGRVSSCGCLVSKNENIIKEWLDLHNIKYERQKRFDGCKNKRQLMFDFYIPSINGVIEYDGEFHYQKIKGLNNDPKYQQQNDLIKDQFCLMNDIKILRIPYWEKDNIESILSEWLNINCVEEANSSNADLSA